jgi:hypothetical protein
LLEFHVIGSWNPDIVPGATAAMGGGKARTSHPRALASGLCQISFVPVVTICIAVDAGGARVHMPETCAFQLCKLCISPFIRGKYDFTSQFI